MLGRLVLNLQSSLIYPLINLNVVKMACYTSQNTTKIKLARVLIEICKIKII